MHLRLASAIALTTSLLTLAARVDTSARQTPSLAVPALSHALGYYDTSLRRVVLVGESGDPTEAVRDRVWSWTGTRWEAEAMPGPTARSNAGAAFERKRGVAVVAGGARRTDGTWHSVADTWIGDRAGWQTIGDLPARDHHALVETRDGGVLMFGGNARTTPWPTDTWELRDRAWVRVATEGPAGRSRTALAFDRARNQVVLFGGVSANLPGGEQTFFGDTWIWNGADWRKAADGGPRGRYAHGMTFDEKRGVVLMYSGAGAHKGAPLEDMWQWDGQRWTEIPLTGPTPGHRYQPVMVYDAARDRTVLVGGLGGPADTWEWDGTRWTRIAP